MNKQKFFKLRTDIELSVLKSLLSEGRLYVSSSSDELVQKAVASTLKQMRKIDDFCHEPYRKTIAEIWESILEIRQVDPLEVHKNKATQMSAEKPILARQVFYRDGWDEMVLRGILIDTVPGLGYLHLGLASYSRLRSSNFSDLA